MLLPEGYILVPMLILRINLKNDGKNVVYFFTQIKRSVFIKMIVCSHLHPQVYLTIPSFNSLAASPHKPHLFGIGRGALTLPQGLDFVL